jgi:multiple sugar transport system substrate-binding protein
MTTSPNVALRRRLISATAITALAVTALAFTAAPSTGAAAKKKTKAVNLKGQKLSIYGWASSPEEDAALTGLLDTWNKKTGAKAKFLPQKEYDTAIQAALASGAGPDVFYVDSFKMPDLLKAGALAPVPAGAIANPDDIYPSLRSVFTSAEGKLICPPKDFSTLALAYDADFLKAKGVNPPTNWDELKVAAEKLTTDGRAGLVMGFEYPRVGVFMFQAGGAMTDAKIKAMTVNTPQNKAAFSLLTDLYSKKFLQAPDEVSAGWAGEALGKQKAAMIIEGNWVVSYLKKDFPGVNAGYAELPSGPAGKGTFAFTVCYGVNKNSKNQEAAWKMVDALTNAEGSLAWTNAFNVMPARASVADKWLSTHANLKPFVSGAQYARKFQFVPGFGDVQGEFNKGLKDVFSGKVTFEDYASKVDKAGNSVLGG